MSIEQFLGQLASKNDDTIPSDRYAVNTPERLDFLKEKVSLLLEKHTFKPGDVVQWKDGLKNRVGGYDARYVVVEVFDEPIFDANKNGSGSQYFHEPLDLCLAKFDNDGDLITYWYDSRRFEPFSQS